MRQALDAARGLADLRPTAAPTSSDAGGRVARSRGRGHAQAACLWSRPGLTPDDYATPHACARRWTPRAGWRPGARQPRRLHPDAGGRVAFRRAAWDAQAPACWSRTWPDAGRLCRRPTHAPGAGRRARAGRPGPDTARLHPDLADACVSVARRGHAQAACLLESYLG